MFAKHFNARLVYQYQIKGFWNVIFTLWNELCNQIAWLKWKWIQRWEKIGPFKWDRDYLATWRKSTSPLSIFWFPFQFTHPGANNVWSTKHCRYLIRILFYVNWVERTKLRLQNSSSSADINSTMNLRLEPTYKAKALRNPHLELQVEMYKSSEWIF